MGPAEKPVMSVPSGGHVELQAHLVQAGVGVELAGAHEDAAPGVGAQDLASPQHDEPASGVGRALMHGRVPQAIDAVCEHG